jgi:hypothetical protein
LDNTSIDNTKAKIFTVTGGISSPAITRVDFPLNASAVSSREYTMTLTRQKLDTSDYEFFRALQCGAQNLDFWYSSLSGFLYGGANGIAPSEINVSFPKGAGKTDTDSVVIEIKWTACGDADRSLVSLL